MIALLLEMMGEIGGWDAWLARLLDEDAFTSAVHPSKQQVSSTSALQSTVPEAKLHPTPNVGIVASQRAPHHSAVFASRKHRLGLP